MSVTPEFHLYLPQMRLGIDAMVEKAQAAEAAGFTGMAGMDHLAPPMALEHAMYEAITSSRVAAGPHRAAGPGAARALRRVPTPRGARTRGRDPRPRFRRPLRARDRVGFGDRGIHHVRGHAHRSARDRVQRLAETLDILRALWSGEAFDYDGQFFHMEAARQVPVPIGRIPVVIGGTGKRTMELVAKHADWWNVPIHQLDRLDEMRASAGNARVSVQQMFAFVPEGVDRAEIEEPARRRFGYHSLIVGGRDELVDHFSAMRDRGVERFYVWFADFAPPSTLEAFGAEVVRRVRLTSRAGSVRPVGQQRVGAAVVVADEAAVAERHRRPLRLHRVADRRQPGHVGQRGVAVEVESPAQADAACPPQHHRGLGLVGGEGGVGPPREPAGRFGVGARGDDPGAAHRPPQHDGAVTGQHHRVLLALEQAVGDLGVVLPPRRSAGTRTRVACAMARPARSSWCVQCWCDSVHWVTARQRSDSGMPASARNGSAAALHVAQGARTEDARDREHACVVVAHGDGEVVDVVLEATLDHARCGRDDPNPAAVAAVGEEGGCVGLAQGTESTRPHRVDSPEVRP